MNIENYIGDLSPELQEKAKTCASIDELLKFAGENGIELTDEQTALISAGGGCGSKSIIPNKDGYDIYNRDFGTGD